MPKSGIKILLLVLGAMFVFWGCGIKRGPVYPVTCYTLDYESPEIPGNKPRLKKIIRVAPFAVNPANQSFQMIYSENNYTRNEYNYRQWRAAPGAMTSYFLARDLENSGLFEAAMSYESRLPATHSLEGIVESFYEEDLNDRWFANLKISVILMKLNEPDISRRVLFQKTYSAKEPAIARNPLAVAEAMSRAMKKVSLNVITDVYEALHEKPVFNLK